MPILARDFNPAIVESLNNLAEVARDEQDYWDAIVRKTMSELRSTWGPFLFDVDRFRKLPVAMQRRILLGNSFPDFDHVEQARKFIVAGNAGEREITRRILVRVVRDSAGHPLFTIDQNPLYEDPARGTTFNVELKLPGVTSLPLRDHRILVATFFSPEEMQRLTTRGWASDYALLDASLCGRTLAIRNWRPGDRYQPSGRGEGKVKDFFKEFHIPAYARATWPVGELDGEIVWVHRLPVAARYVCKGDSALAISERSTLFI